MNQNKSSAPSAIAPVRPLDVITIDDVELDMMVRKGRAVPRRVIARLLTDKATGKLLTLKLENASATLTPWAKANIERGFAMSTDAERVRVGGCFVFFGTDDSDPWNAVEVKVVAKHRGKFRVRITNAAQRALAKGRRLAVRTCTDANLW